MCRNNRPQPPSINTSKSNLQELVKSLYQRLDEGDQALAAAYARERLANAENGRIRKQLHAKKLGRAKVTAVHTGARILTAEDSRVALVKADAKRVLGPVIQELGPLVKMTKKVSTSIQKAKDGNVVREELAGIKAAQEQVKHAEKSKLSIEKKLKTAQNRLTAACDREEKATTPSAIRNAQKSCQNFRSQIVMHEDTLETLNEQVSEAKSHHMTLVEQRDKRLAAITEAEAPYRKAMAEIERGDADAKRKATEKAERLARMPKRLKEPIPIWMERFEQRLRRQEALDNNEEYFDLPADNPDDDSVATDRSDDEWNNRIGRINERLTSEFGSYVDSELIQSAAEQMAGRASSGEVEE